MMVALTLLLATVVARSLLQFEGELERDTAVTTESVNPWSGDPGDLLRLSDPRAGATDVRARINFTIQPGSSTDGNSLNSVYVEMTSAPASTMFAGTTQGDLERVAVDYDSDGSVDQDITGDVDDWQVKNGGSTVKIGLSGSAYVADEGDSIVVEFDGVDNPTSPGTYDLQAQTSGDGNWHYGSVTVS